MQGFGGLTQGFMPLAGQISQNVDRTAELAFLNNVLNQYVSASDAALRSGGTVSMPDFGNFAQTFDPNSMSNLISNLFGTGGRAIKFGTEGGGQTQGTGPGPMTEYASFQDFANAVANDKTGLARAFGLAAGMLNPLGTALFTAAQTMGVKDEPPSLSFDITSSFSGGGGFGPDPLGGFGGSPELGGRSDPSQGGGGPDPSDPSASDPTGGSASF